MGKCDLNVHSYKNRHDQGDANGGVSSSGKKLPATAFWNTGNNGTVVYSHLAKVYLHTLSLRPLVVMTVILSVGVDDSVFKLVLCLFQKHYRLSKWCINAFRMERFKVLHHWGRKQCIFAFSFVPKSA